MCDGGGGGGVVVSLFRVLLRDVAFGGSVWWCRRGVVVVSFHVAVVF